MRGNEHYQLLKIAKVCFVRFMLYDRLQKQLIIDGLIFLLFIQIQI